MSAINYIKSAQQTDTVVSKDGTIINYQITGTGPGLILIHGVLSSAANYRALAELLGENFTVYSIERRGRGLSGPQGDDYSIEMECEDIDALQGQTQATYLFGHSYGGLIALETARRNKTFKKIAVYEPGVSIDGSINISWMPEYQKLLAQKKYLDAFAVFSITAGPENAQKTPLWLMKILLPFFIKKEGRDQKYSLLPANLLEHKQVAAKDNSYKNYREISASVLLMTGGKSGLKWVDKAIKTLSEVLANSKVIKFTRLNHFGPDETGPEEVAREVKEYFSR
jgi:pimeloyl-ACP methyl ester carboxylesterase